MMLELTALTSGYPGSRGVVVDPVSLTLESGAFVSVIGRNGAGKSTLMRTLSGLQPAVSGIAALGGVDIAQMNARERAQAISVVTTDRVSSPGLLARDVVELGRQPYTNWRGRLTREDQSIVRAATVRAGATELLSKPFDSLSDGERQRVMIARALAVTPSVLIADEPLAALDASVQAQVINLLRQLCQQHRLILIMVSHDLAAVASLCQEMMVVRQGCLVEYGPCQQLIKEPSTDYTAALLQACRDPLAVSDGQ